MTNKKGSITRFSNLVKSFLAKEAKIEESKEDYPIKEFDCLAYFSYTTILPNWTEEENDVVIMGNLCIRNTGKSTLHHPIICIRLNPPNTGRLGGKIIIHEHLTDAPTQEQWVHVHSDWKERIKETGEYWLRPKHINEITAGDQIVFSNFELLLDNLGQTNAVSVDGYIYFQELQEGTSALNSIGVHC